MRNPDYWEPARGCLAENLDADCDDTTAAWDDEVELVERDEPDGRLPARDNVANVTITVAFNTIPGRA